MIGSSHIEVRVGRMARRELMKGLQRGASLYSIHDEETEGDAGRGLLSLYGDPGAVGYGRVAHVLMKEAAERAQALKSDLEADIRHGQAAGTEQLLGALNPPSGQVLMRRLLKSLPE